jgi:signal transduction histidine kinase
MSPSHSVRGWWGRRSLRARLTAAATLAIVLTLSVAAYALLLVVHWSMQRGVDNTARERARAVGATVTTASADAIVDVQRRSDAVVQVVDVNGNVVVSSSNARGLPRLFFFTPSGTESVRTTSNRLPVVDGADSYRVAVFRTSRGALVYAGIANDDVRENTRLVAVSLVGGVPVLTVLLAVVTWLLVGRALRPVEALRGQAARITATDLKQRLTPSEARDELRRLAETLNDMLDRLESSTLRQREFVADAAHELRSPLTVMRAQLEVATAHPDGQAAMQLPLLLWEVERVSGLVDNLLHLARLDSAPASTPRLVDLDDVVFDEVGRVRPATNITFDVSKVSAAQVEGEVTGLVHLVRNLLDNAARHASARVDISLRVVDDTVELMVTDDGPGVPPADRERIFERFTRLDESRSRIDGGFGLGLAIVRDVARAHRGDATVTDGGPGACFVVRLPRARRTSSAAENVSRQEPSAATDRQSNTGTSGCRESS